MNNKRAIVFGRLVLMCAALTISHHSEAQGVLTPGKSAAPYVVAARAVYCRDALSADTGMWGTRKAEPQDEEKKKTWRAIQDEAQYWAALHGKWSLYGMHFKFREISVVADTTRASCDADLAVIKSETARVMGETWKSGWETANRRNRADRTIVDGTKDDTFEITGWCTQVLDRSLPRLRRRPAAFGYDAQSAADVALVERIASRLERSRQKWREFELAATKPFDKLSLLAGQREASETYFALREQAGTAQITDIVLRHWLATEADLCVRLTLPDESEVTFPPIAGGSAWVPTPPRPRSTTPFAFVWIAELCRAAELTRGNGTANAVAQAWLPIHEQSARWAMRHGQSLRLLDIDVRNTQFTPAHEAACAKDLQQLKGDFTARVQQWDAEEETARKTPFIPALGKTVLENAFEYGWCARMNYQFAETLERSPAKMGLNAATADDRVKIENHRKIRQTAGGDWVSRFMDMRQTDSISQDTLREQFNAGMASFQRYAEIVKDDPIALPWLFAHETDSCAALQ